MAALLVERVETRDRRVVKVKWTGAARPFFAAASVDADEDAASGEGLAGHHLPPRSPRRLD